MFNGIASHTWVLFARNFDTVRDQLQNGTTFTLAIKCNGKGFAVGNGVLFEGKQVLNNHLYHFKLTNTERRNLLKAMATKELSLLQ